MLILPTHSLKVAAAPLATVLAEQQLRTVQRDQLTVACLTEWAIDGLRLSRRGHRTPLPGLAGRIPAPCACARRSSGRCCRVAARPCRRRRPPPAAPHGSAS